MRLIHDLYAERFADFGIERGERGRKKYRKAVDQAKALDAKRVAAGAAEDRERTARDNARSALARVVRYRGEAESEVCIRDEARAARRDEEAGFKKAQEGRKREEAATKAAREQLEADAVRGTTGRFGRRARLGRELREADEDKVKDLGDELDAAKAERDKAKEDLEAANKALGDERSARRKDAATAERNLRKQRDDANERMRQVLRTVGRLVKPLVSPALAVLLPVTLVPRLRKLTELLDVGDPDEVVNFSAAVEATDNRIANDLEEGRRLKAVRAAEVEGLRAERKEPVPGASPGASQGRVRPREGGMER